MIAEYPLLMFIFVGNKNIYKMRQELVFKLNAINGRKRLNPSHHVNEYTNRDGEHYSDLVSYTTRVASYNHNTNEMSVYSCQSATTATHINSFLDHYGFDTCTKSKLQSY